MIEQAGMLNNQLSKIPYLKLTENDISRKFSLSIVRYFCLAVFDRCALRGPRRHRSLTR